MTTRNCRWLLSCCAFALACRFGGPKEDPARWLDFGSDAATDRGGEEDPGVDPGARADSGDLGGAAGSIGPADAMPEVDGAGPHTPNDASAPSEPRLDASGEGGSACSPPSPSAVCDPVHDTGCEPDTQCDVDLTLELTGLCAFSTPYDAAVAPCVATPLSESCPSGHTCVFGSCRRLCYCDADCTPGECCVEPLDISGWTLCAPCP